MSVSFATYYSDVLLLCAININFSILSNWKYKKKWINYPRLVARINYNFRRDIFPPDFLITFYCKNIFHYKESVKQWFTSLTNKRSTKPLRLEEYSNSRISIEIVYSNSWDLGKRKVVVWQWSFDNILSMINDQLLI